MTTIVGNQITIREIIKDAMVEVGAISISDEPDMARAQHALNKFRDMLSGWENEGYLTPGRIELEFTLPASNTSHRIFLAKVSDATAFNVNSLALEVDEEGKQIIVVPTQGGPPPIITRFTVRTGPPDSTPSNIAEQSSREYANYLSSTSIGTPTGYFYRKHPDRGEIIFNIRPTNGLVFTIVYEGHFVGKNMGIEGMLTILPEYRDAFIMNLARNIITTMGGATLSITDRRHIERRALETKRLLYINKRDNKRHPLETTITYTSVGSRGYLRSRGSFRDGL